MWERCLEYGGGKGEDEDIFLKGNITRNQNFMFLKIEKEANTFEYVITNKNAFRTFGDEAGVG